MGPDPGDRSTFEDDDPVGVHDRADTLGDDEDRGVLHLSAFWAGLVFAGFGVGALAGALGTTRFQRAVGVGRAIWIPSVLFSVAGFAFPLAPHGSLAVPVLLAATLVFGLAGMSYNITQVSYRQAITPERPFFTYVALGATHAPFHVAPEWRDQYAGRVDDGWDALRKRTFARQKELGVIPDDADLTTPACPVLSATPAKTQVPEGPAAPVRARAVEPSRRGLALDVPVVAEGAGPVPLVAALRAGADDASSLGAAQVRQAIPEASYGPEYKRCRE